MTLAQYWLTAELDRWFYPVFEINLETLLSCLMKTRMYKLAQQADVPYPQTRYSPVQVDDIAPSSFPVVVKPHNRRSVKSLRKNVFRLRLCEDIDQLQEAISFLEHLQEAYVVQEYIPGLDDQLYTAGIFAYKGELVAAFTGRKVRQFPRQMGECAYGELVDKPEIIEYANRLVKKVGYTGIAQVEFKYYKGTYYLMEINPRSWSWNSLATFAG